RSIRTGWFSLVLPALLLQYLGQGALLLEHPEFAQQPFFYLAPGWAVIPLVVLATGATVIASQSVISGTFSLTMQAVQWGYLPGLTGRGTSEKRYGQIYVPPVNWALMFAAIALVVGFGESSELAAAFGMAVSG